MRPIRNSVKALIVAAERLLVIEKTGGDGPYYILPGGGQESGEDFHTALKRECREEIGAEVQVGELRWVREYIGIHHEFGATDAEVHQVEFMFSCTLGEDAVVGLGSAPDEDQTGIAWLPLSSLPQKPFYPRSLALRVAGEKEGAQVVYLGDVN